MMATNSKRKSVVVGWKPFSNTLPICPDVISGALESSGRWDL